MQTMNEILIAEATEYEFKGELEVKKPKSWLKTVSAFANGLGGRFFLGVDDDGNPIGLADVKNTAEQISQLIKDKISPLPDFLLTPYQVDDGKNILVLQIPRGMNLNFDSLPTDYKKADLAFTIFEATYKKIAKKPISEKEYVSFGMSRSDGVLT